MSASGEEPQPDGDGNETQGQPMSSIQEISGGHHEQTYMGGQFGQYIQTQVNKTYNPVGEYGKPLKEGEFQVGCIITVHENCPISLSSRIFNATLHSDVTGDKDSAVKITAAERRNYREAKTHFSVPHHKNIVERIATNTFNFRGQPSIFIAMERCDCNLHDHVKKEIRDKYPFDEQKYTWIAYQIFVGLDFLHLHNVIHGDFKPSNVLLILNGNIAKLSDFGLSKPITAGKESTYATSQAGTIGWQAPEVLKGARKITLASDIFPGGLVLHFVWSHGKHPYGNKAYSLQHNIAKGINQDLSRLLISNSDDAKPLLKWMLENKPAKRPTSKQVLDHEVFASLGSKPPKVTESKLYKIVNNAVEGIKKQDATLSKNESSIDQQKIIPLAVTVDQLSGAMKSVFETKKIEFSVPRPCRLDDAQIAEVFDQIFSLMHPQGPEASDLSEDDVTPFGATVGQLQTALKSFLERNRQQTRMSSAPEALRALKPDRLKIGRSAPLTGQRSALRQSQTPSLQPTETMDAEVSRKHEESSQPRHQAHSSKQSPPPPPPRGRPASGSVETDYTTPKTTFSPEVTQKHKESSQPRYQVHSSKQSPPPPPPRGRPASGSVEAVYTTPKTTFSPESKGVINSLRKVFVFPSQQQETQNANIKGSPLCRRGCDIILMSPYSIDEQYLPQLTSQIYGTKSYNGKREFICCDYHDDPGMIQERLSNIPVCDEGITMIVVAYKDATRLLTHALKEKNLRRFLRNKGSTGNGSKQNIQNMRRNLAVFMFYPWDFICQDSAKIAVNIDLSEDKCEGKLQTTAMSDGNVNKVTFQGTFSTLRYPWVEDFINNEEITVLLMNLLTLSDPEYCSQH